MRIVSVVLMCFVILLTGCFDKEPPKKEAVKKPTIELLEVEPRIRIRLVEIFNDFFLKDREEWEDKWKGKWIYFSASVRRKREDSLVLTTGFDNLYLCYITDNLFYPNLHKYEVDQYYYFSARIKDMSDGGFYKTLSLEFVENGRVVIPEGYTGIIDVDFEHIFDNTIKFTYHEWLGKRVRFVGKVNYKSEDGDSFRVINPYGEGIDLLERNGFIISGFEPHSEFFHKCEDGKSYIFAVKIENLHPIDVMFGHYMFEASIISE